MSTTSENQLSREQSASAIAHGVAEVTVSYLPAPKPFHHAYADSTVIGTIRLDAMRYFGVSDHQDRDKHEFFLEFRGRRLIDMTETLKALLGPNREGAHFNLVEQITQGGIAWLSGIRPSNIG